MKIKLVDDWKEAWKWSEIRIMFVLSALLAATPSLAQDLATNWPTLYPYIQTWFPEIPQTFWPAAGAVLAMIARIFEVNSQQKENG